MCSNLTPPKTIYEQADNQIEDGEQRKERVKKYGIPISQLEAIEKFRETRPKLTIDQCVDLIIGKSKEENE